jgi:hypothetical protein
MKTKLLTLSIFSVFLLMLHADTGRDMLTEIGYDDGTAAEIFSGQPLINKDNEAILYFPPKAYLSQRLSGIINNSLPQVTVEAVYYFNAPALPDRLELFNNLLKISTLSGTTYDDGRSSTKKVLIRSASTVESADSKIVVPDVQVTERPQNLTVFMNETSAIWGNASYKVTYYAQGDEVAMAITNTSVMKQNGMFTYAAAGEFMTLLYCIPADDGYLLYTASFLNKTHFPFFTGSRDTELLVRRLNALSSWFSSHYPQ